VFIGSLKSCCAKMCQYVFERLIGTWGRRGQPPTWDILNLSLSGSFTTGSSPSDTMMAPEWPQSLYDRKES
jgi:hypothetical protein